MISCDEAGFTGNNMLDAAQPHFAYASHDLVPEEAAEILADARERFPVQMPELKARQLLKTERGRGLVLHVLGRMKGRYMATLYEKKLSLACKFFEYVYEPVLQRNNALFYNLNLHRFFGMYLYMQFGDQPIDALAAEFEAFMRSLDPADAPSLLGDGDGLGDGFPLLDPILRFAKGYNVAIARETEVLNRSQAGKWVLDLTTTSVFTQLARWGERHEVIEVTCDDSKPLRSLANEFDVMIDRPERVHVEMFGKRVPLTWNMSGPIAYGSSVVHPGIQLADIVAGATAAIPSASNRPELMAVVHEVLPHLLDDCILPDWDLLDLSTDATKINWVVLGELAERADQGEDPLLGMENFIAAARQIIGSGAYPILD